MRPSQATLARDGSRKRSQPMRVLGVVALLLVAVCGGAVDVAAPIPGTEPAREWSSCIPNLGCINTTEAWYHAVYRPFNPLPNKLVTLRRYHAVYRPFNPLPNKRFTLRRYHAVYRPFNPLPNKRFTLRRYHAVYRPFNPLPNKRFTLRRYHAVYRPFNPLPNKRFTLRRYHAVYRPFNPLPNKRFTLRRYHAVYRPFNPLPNKRFTLRRYHAVYRPFNPLPNKRFTLRRYHAVYRPFNPLPNKRFTIKTTFVLFARNGSRDGERFTATAASVAAAGFNKSAPTTVVVHDFTSSGQTGWVRRLSQALLAREGRNVVAVDWENGALPPYAQAAANARVVALELTKLLQVLQSSFAVDAGAVHVVGHGLGAHIAGYVGAAVRGLGRITGLDPSGPYFQGMPPDVRLDAGDAAFVDVIHTDAATPGRDDPVRADGQGIDDPLGHIDFYPNGGRDQPGCSSAGERNLLAVTRDSLPGGSILRGCSHKRAFKYYVESLAAAGCQFLAFQCADYATFLQGKCETCGLRGARCSVMGDKARHFPAASVGRFYVQTANATPFCDYVYRVNLDLAKPPQAKAQVSGWMVLSLVGKAGPPIAMPLESKVVLKHGTTQQLLAFHGEPYVSPVAKAQLSWRYQTHLLSPSTVCIRCDDSLYVSKVEVTSLPALPHLNETTVTLCSCDGTDPAKVRSNSSHVFVPCSQDSLAKWQKLTTLQH